MIKNHTMKILQLLVIVLSYLIVPVALATTNTVKVNVSVTDKNSVGTGSVIIENLQLSNNAANIYSIISNGSSSITAKASGSDQSNPTTKKDVFVLLNTTGTPISGTLNLTFTAIFKDSSGNTIASITNAGPTKITMSNNAFTLP